jgi:hypothetical protein
MLPPATNSKVTVADITRLAADLSVKATQVRHSIRWRKKKGCRGHSM